VCGSLGNLFGIFNGLPLQSVQDMLLMKRLLDCHFRNLPHMQLLELCNYVYSGIALNREWQESQQIWLQADGVDQVKQKFYAGQGRWHMILS
jgi:hypothetical protein